MQLKDRKNFLMVRAVAQWDQFLERLVRSLRLEVFKQRLLVGNNLVLGFLLQARELN